LLTLFKILHSEYDSTDMLKRMELYVPSRRVRSGKEQTFHIRRFRTEARRRSFLWRAGRAYNNLSVRYNDFDIFSGNVRKFKNSLNVIDDWDLEKM